MNEHTSRAFEQELRTLRANLERMGHDARRMLEQSVKSLVAGDDHLAGRVISQDLLLDASQRELESLAVHVIARRQPLADDLRSIVAGMRMAGDLERVGDLAKNIAKRSAAAGSQPLRRELAIGVESLHAAVDEQLGAVLAAYEQSDANLAEKVRTGDEKIDAMHNTLFRELLTYMLEDPRNISSCTQLMFAVKNLERIGDHATNLAENVLYSLTGQLAEDRPKDDSIPSAAE